ncbi:MAG: energy transducer TonB [Cyanobacteria bacterium P01_D01_bin.56]
MAKSRLPKLNSWVTLLVLASIGLHGLVLALPMPGLVEEEPEKTEYLDPDAIQVVSLPKLATGSEESEELPLPEPPEEEPELPEEEPEQLIEEPIVTDPEILEDLAPEPKQDPDPEEPKEPARPEDEPENNPEETELDKALKQRENYGNFDGEKAGTDYRDGGTAFKGELTGWMFDRISSNANIFKTDYLAAIEAELPTVKSLKCLDEAPSEFVSVIVQVSESDGSLVEDAESPYALNSTGHKILDDKALEIATKADYSPYFNAAEPAPGYWFNIRVEYDDSDCS